MPCLRARVFVWALQRRLRRTKRPACAAAVCHPKTRTVNLQDVRRRSGVAGCWRASEHELMHRARADLPGLEAPGKAGKMAGKPGMVQETPADRPEKIPPVDFKYTSPFPPRGSG